MNTHNMKDLCVNDEDAQARRDESRKRMLNLICKPGDENCERQVRIQEEFQKGFDVIEKYDKTVTIFGSARTKEDNPHYIMARKLAGMLSQAGFGVVTGGGHGIMEAGNRGAVEAGGEAIGFNIELPFEQTINDYVTDQLEFHYFFSRKVIMSFSAEAYIYFPGGFGTLDEFFEIITLIQTKKIPQVPVFCVGSDFWNPIQETLISDLRDTFQTISPGDENLYTITDDLDAVVEAVKNAPLRDE